MLISPRLRRKMLPWLCAAAFVANFLCADAVLCGAWLPIGSESPESAHQQAESVSQQGYERLTFGLASAQAASTGAKERRQVIDFLKMAMGGVAGLVLFIYGVTRLAESLEELSTERMRKFLSTATTNRFAGVFTGIVATTLLESSSVTIIMVIAMVSGGVLTFVQSLGVVLGSNIGTAVGAQIISLDIKHYVAVLMAVGVVGFLLGRTKTQKNLGLVVLGFGLMFYGIEAIDDAMRPFRTY
jgi:phosphate:Na+ symporter